MSTVLIGDCRDLMPAHGPFDMILADPPYGDTSLAWDRRVDGWLTLARDTLRPTGSLWVFGSLRSFMATANQFAAAGFRCAQEIVWEKQNGSSFHADRFKRVHELVVQFYRADTRWRDIYNDVQTTPDATPRTVRRKRRPPHTGHIEAGHYVSDDGGPRLMRSVIRLRNCHGRAIHPTEKPTALLEILIRTSCPEDGLVGDWFAGSGAAGEACRLSGRRYLGCEIDADMAERARARIAAVLPFRDGGAAQARESSPSEGDIP
jgi:site-specific DNA-methyltransferase (adenine-specific)